MAKHGTTPPRMASTVASSAGRYPSGADAECTVSSAPRFASPAPLQIQRASRPPQTFAPPRDGETETRTEPETTPDGQTETEGATKLEDDPQCETCPQCAPRDMGPPVIENIHGPNEALKHPAFNLRHIRQP